MGILGEKEAILKCPPTATGSTDIAAGQALTLTAATSSVVTPLVPSGIVTANGDPWGSMGNGYWFTMVCTADVHVRFFGADSPGGAVVDPGASVVGDYLIPAFQEREFWCDSRSQSFRAFSTPGGVLNWYRSSR